MHDIKNALYSGECPCEEQSDQTLNLIVVGQTGSGKTTLIDALVNHILGTEFYDSFRYRLVDEEELQTRRLEEMKESGIYKGTGRKEV